MTKNGIKTIVILMFFCLLIVGNVAGNPVSDCLNDDVLPIDWATLKWDFDALDFDCLNDDVLPIDWATLKWDFDWTIIDPPVYERM